MTEFSIEMVERGPALPSNTGETLRIPTIHTSIRIVEFMSPMLLPTFPWKDFNPVQFQTQNSCGAWAFQRNRLVIDIFWPGLTLEATVGHDWSRHPSLKGCDLRSLGQVIRNKACHEMIICRCKNPWCITKCWTVPFQSARISSSLILLRASTTSQQHFAPPSWEHFSRVPGRRQHSQDSQHREGITLANLICLGWGMLGYAWIQWYTWVFWTCLERMDRWGASMLGNTWTHVRHGFGPKIRASRLQLTTASVDRFFGSNKLWLFIINPLLDAKHPEECWIWVANIPHYDTVHWPRF